MKKTLTLLFFCSMILTACDSTHANATLLPPIHSPSSAATTLERIPLGAGFGARGAWFELYFTNPQSALAKQKTGGPDAALAAAIDAAKLSVDVAIYSLSLNSIRDALLNAHARGVRVRIVMESDNLDRSDPQKLKDAGIPILGDRREGLMHDKFVVIDNSEVWTGAMNFTDSGGYEDNNNLMRIHSTKMAENYTKEFEEMFVDDKFGPDVVAETPNPRITLDGTEIDVYFAPDDHVEASLLDLLNNAMISVYFMAFSFTSDPLGDTLKKLADNGVYVSGVMEDQQIKSNIGTEFDPFQQAKMDVWRDGNEGQMHHKTIIIDARIVVMGSYNFSQSADTKNDENLLVIYNKDIAVMFLEEFKRVYDQAK